MANADRIKRTGGWNAVDKQPLAAETAMEYGWEQLKPSEKFITTSVLPSALLFPQFSKHIFHFFSDKVISQRIDSFVSLGATFACGALSLLSFSFPFQRLLDFIGSTLASKRYSFRLVRNQLRAFCHSQYSAAVISTETNWILQFQWDHTLSDVKGIPLFGSHVCKYLLAEFIWYFLRLASAESPYALDKHFRNEWRLPAGAARSYRSRFDEFIFGGIPFSN